MRYDTINYAAVGGFVLLMLVTLGLALYQITGSSGPSDRYHAWYDNVAGVKYGTPVYFEGYPVGEVVKIEPQHGADGVRYRVTLAIQRGWPVPKDSLAAIAATGLLADVSISILEGSSRERLEPGAEIASREGSDIFSAFNQLATEVRGLTEDSLKPLAQELNTALGGGAAPIVQDLRSLLAKLNHSADSLNLILGPDNRRELAQALKNVNELSASLTETRAQVDRLLAQANGMLEDNRPEVRASVRELRASLEAVSGRIDTIMVQLEAASRNMQEFSREVRANPGRLLADKPPTDAVETRR
jgi:phospholipid/cholesterol/gamma-HCH transport system substrate-binding protein